MKPEEKAEGMHIKESYKLVIIGAGPSGLCLTRLAKENQQMKDSILMLQRQNDIGGIWHPGHGYTWDTMTTNLSKYYCAFTDYPWYEGADTFPMAGEMFKYLKRYSEHFDILKYVQLNSTVTQVDQKGQNFEVTWVNNLSKKQYRVHAERVVVASGMFSRPFIPTYKGLETFKGNIIHSTKYKEPSSMTGKRVLTVGGSFTGIQLTSDISRTSELTIHNFRQKFFLIGHFVEREIKDEKGENRIQKVPVDFLLFTRKYLRMEGMSKEEQLKERNSTFYSISQNKNIDNQALKINEEDMKKNLPFGISTNYANNLKKGKILAKNTKIVEFKENSVIFEDGSEENIDTIVFCTGFRNALDFLSEEIKQKMNYDEYDNRQPGTTLFQIIPPQIPNFYLLGQFKGIGIAACQIQAQFVEKIMTGKAELPDQETIEREINQERAIRKMVPPPQSINPNYIIYGDKLANCFKDNELNFNKFKEEAPELFKKYIEFPNLQDENSYRLSDVENQVKKIEAIMKSFIQVEETEKVLV